MNVALTNQIIDGPALLASLLSPCDDAGAVVSFCGVARSASSDGQQVSALTLEAHPTLTEQSLKTIASAALVRFQLADVSIVHRWGSISSGETIVFVAATSTHRRAAFEATNYLMDRLKTEAVLWKKEDTSGGSHWIEPSEADLEAAASWLEDE